MYTVPWLDQSVSSRSSINLTNRADSRLDQYGNPWLVAGLKWYFEVSSVLKKEQIFISFPDKLVTQLPVIMVMILISTYVLVFLTYMLVFLTCSNFILRTRAFCIKVTTWIHLCFLNSWVILINCGTLKFFRYFVSFKELSLNTKHQRFLIFKEGREFILKFQSDDLLYVWVSLLNTKKN